MEIDFECVEGVGVFKPHGSLDYASSIKLMEAVTARFSPTIHAMVISFANVENLNSSGFTILEILFAEARRNGVRMGLSDIHGFAAEVMQHLPGLSGEAYFPTQADAINTFNARK